ncbi:DUF2474 family protein [Pseudoroseicyclus tamaricis]|uniref:DUF2474 family protein n=1 Tax=Pseudoroseicyclus tamaricis TaxID=2705421 RepID=A0A6B2JR44_9RHOB|nr:DUF2474 family protein [Pseudoroseicyclus tamaricis]NDV00648.1 DUF2474 family protein [Pseudoroseicyclus tamaricis]
MKRGWPKRVAWFVGLWLVGVATVGTVAWIIRMTLPY